MDDAAAQYHRLTKYDEVSIRRGPGLDFQTQPGQVKDIVSSHRVRLRPYLPFRTRGPGGERHQPDPGDGQGGVGLGSLARLLFHTNGPTGLIRYPNAEQWLRAAPSAGALYPTEIYVACRDLPGLPAGLYSHHVPGHELVRLWDGDQVDIVREACGASETPDAAAWLILTGIFWRSAWRYHERGYRRVLLDTGHVLGNMIAYAPHTGLSTTVHTGFVDAAINGLFFFDDTVEVALVCIALHEYREGEEPCTMARPWRSFAVTDGDVSEKHPIRGEDDVKDSATLAVHRASSCEKGAPVPAPRRVAKRDGALRTDQTLPLETDPDTLLNIPLAILQRRSARAYRKDWLPMETTEEVLAYAFDGELPGRAADLLRVHLVSHTMQNVSPGLYEVEGRGEALRPIENADMSARVHRLLMGQDIGKTCAGVIVFSAPAEPALEVLGDRAYRLLHLEAGVVGQRIQLAATALGATACGIGGFFDDECATLVDLGVDDWVLYLVTIGLPPQ